MPLFGWKEGAILELDGAVMDRAESLNSCERQETDWKSCCKVILDARGAHGITGDERKEGYDLHDQPYSCCFHPRFRKILIESLDESQICKWSLDVLGFLASKSRLHILRYKSH